MSTLQLTEQEFRNVLTALDVAPDPAREYAEVSSFQAYDCSNKLADTDNKGTGHASFYSTFFLNEEKSASITLAVSGSYESHGGDFKIEETQWTSKGIHITDGYQSADLILGELDTLNFASSHLEYGNLQGMDGFRGNETKDVGIDATSGKDDHALSNSYGPTYEFNGELLAEASTYSPHKNDRYEDIDIYQVADGSFVAHISSLTQWKGEEDRFELKQADTLDEVQEFLEAHTSQQFELSGGHDYSRDNDPYHDLVTEVMEEAQTKLQEREALSI